MSPFMMIVMNGITLAIYWLGASLINEGSLDFATMTAFSMLAMQVLMAFMMLTMLFIMLPRASVSAKRINEVLETENRIGEPAEPKPFTERATVEMKNVSFRYPDADGYVLKDISFRAKQGDTVAFIGATGSGKSTLVNPDPRAFTTQTEGEVLVDGVNVREVRQADLRARIGYVPQKGTLFSGTVASNIGYGGVTDDQKIRSAAEVAMASEFVEQMEEGYDSHISQGGKNVSGGQKQRLSIARAAAIDRKSSSSTIPFPRWTIRPTAKCAAGSRSIRRTRRPSSSRSASAPSATRISSSCWTAASPSDRVRTRSS